jgi:hypothetical protein
MWGPRQPEAVQARRNHPPVLLWHGQASVKVGLFDVIDLSRRGGAEGSRPGGTRQAGWFGASKLHELAPIAESVNLFQRSGDGMLEPPVAGAAGVQPLRECLVRSRLGSCV